MTKLTILTDEQLDEIEKYTKAATPPPWDWAGRSFETVEEVKDWLCKMVDYNAENLFLHGVGHMVNGSHMPETVDDVWKFVMPAITGNGPTAEANAKFLSVARSSMPDLVAEVRRLYALEDVLKSTLRNLRGELAGVQAEVRQLQEAHASGNFVAYIEGVRRESYEAARLALADMWKAQNPGDKA